MSSIQIPNLPAVANLSGAELLEAVQAGSSVKVSLNQISALFGIGPVSFPLAVAIGGTGTTTSTGTGSVVLSNNPVLVNPSFSIGSFGLGTVTAPSITFTGDLNTGIWSPGADTIAFSTGGVERMRIDSAGEVGIGTTNPLRPLHIVTSGATPAAMYLQNDTGDASVFLRSQDTGLNTVFFGDTTDFQAGLIQYAHTTNDLIARSAGAMLFQTGGSPERMRIDSTGNVGIGVTTPTFSSGSGLEVQRADAVTTVRIERIGTSANALEVRSGAALGEIAVVSNNPLLFSTNNTERMRIDAAGVVGVGTTIGSSYATRLAVVGGNLGISEEGSTVFTLRSNAGVSSLGAFSSTGAALTFRTAPSGGGEVERMRIDSIGNVGIGVTPSPWVNAATSKAMEFSRGGIASLAGGPVDHFAVFSNAYVSTGTDPATATWNYKLTGSATLYEGGRNGTHRWFTAPSGTAGAAITFTQVMTLNTNGDLGVGTSTVTPIFGRTLQVGDGTVVSSVSLPGTGAGTTGDVYLASSASTATLTARASTDLVLGAGDVERYRIGASGQLGIGGAVYGTAGQAFISGGPSAATSWGTLGLAGGGTGVTTAPAAAAVLYGYTTTATAAGTTVLTNTSSQYQLFTGTLTQTITLPVTSTLTTGWTFHIVNASTGNLTINSSGGNLVATVIPGTTVMVTCILTSGTTAASWEFGYTDFNTLTGTGSVVMSDGATAAFALGAVGTPSITFTGDLNTGIWSPAADTVAVSTNGAERMRITSAGDITQTNAVSGAGAVVGEQTFRLAADGTAFGPAIGDFFGPSSAISLEASSVYEITIYAVFTKTTAGTATWTLTASSAPTRMIGTYQASPITGIAAGAVTSGFAGSQGATTAAFAATGSLTTGVNHAYQFKVQLQTNGAANFRLQLTQSLGTATPLAGSYYTVKKISATTGTFVA